MQSAIVVGSVGGRGGGRRTQKTTNIKRWGWDRSSEVRTLFEGDPARPGHPLRVETVNKLGDCVMKLRCRICRSLISYHNISWTSAATHIRSHNIATAQDIAAAAALASESKANGEAFPIHKLLAPSLVKKEVARDAALMRHTFAAPSYGTDTQPFHRIKRTIAKWIAADCLPYRTVETRDVRWSKFVGTGKERNAFFPVSFPFLFFPAHFRAHLYCQPQTVVARSIFIRFTHFKILQTHKEASYP